MSQHETKAEQSAKQVTVKEQRAALLEAGYKRCPQHIKYLDRLPEEFRTPVNGYEDVSIRPLSEYQKNTSTCRHCDHIIQKDWHATHKQASSDTTVERKRALLARLVEQDNALHARMQELERSLEEQGKETAS